MSITVNTDGSGRLGNQMIRNIAVSFIAGKNNLYVEYSNYEIINNLLGIPLFIGNRIYQDTVILTEENYFDILLSSNVNFNLDANQNYFQTKEIISLIYDYLNNDEIKQNIQLRNPFNSRYNNNQDLCIHFRLGDLVRIGKNEDIDYYIKTTEGLPTKPNYIFLCTDEQDHPFIREYANRFNNVIIVDLNECLTIQLASTCKYLILSSGTFSAVMGYLAFYSTIFYPKTKPDKIWHGDIFCIPSWNCIV